MANDLPVQNLRNPSEKIRDKESRVASRRCEFSERYEEITSSSTRHRRPPCALDVGVGSKPGFISNQNTCALTTNERPQTMHVSELLEQTKDSRDVVRVRRSQVIGSHANQFITLIPNKLAETVRNFDIP